MFVTFRDTLLSVENTLFFHLLAKEFIPDSDGDFVIDRDPTHFARILTFLRTRKYDVEGLTSRQIDQFHAEWDYYLFPRKELIKS